MSIDTIQNYIHSEINARSMPGAALMVYQAGHLSYECYAGTYCDGQRRDIPVNRDVTYMLYSFSKGISATVIVMAHQRGLIDYDAPISVYIPEFKGGWKDSTTIRHLLAHSAGIPKCAFHAVVDEVAWLEEVNDFCRIPTEWKPGSKTVYHAVTGMLLAAEAVRRQVGRRSWQELCREWLFEPIGAQSLTFTPPAEGFIALTPQPKELPCSIVAEKCPLLGHPGAGCFGKIEDVLKILQLHLNQGAWKGKTLIDAGELREMHRIQYEPEIAAAEHEKRAVQHDPWGLGWMIKRKFDEKQGYGYGFGFGHLTSPSAFGHAGIFTVHGVADPASQIALAFIASDSMTESYGRVRNMVSDLVMKCWRPE